MNLLATDGCECEFISDIDEPFDGIDADCDGQDGDPVDGVYVSEIGRFFMLLVSLALVASGPSVWKF